MNEKTPRDTVANQPRCLIMDEPSIGLAPKLFQDLMTPIRALQRERGIVVMKAGRIVREAFPAELADNAALMELY